MDTKETALWTVEVSKDIDTSLHAFLAEQGLEKNALSRFVEEAVSWRIFDLTVAETRARNRHVPPEQLEAEVDEAVAAARAERWRERQAKAGK